MDLSAATSTIYQTPGQQKSFAKKFNKQDAPRKDGLMTYQQFLNAHPEFQTMSSLNFDPHKEYNKYLEQNGAKPQANPINDWFNGKSSGKIDVRC